MLTTRADAYLDKTLGVDVRIGRVGWELPKQIFIRDVHVPTPSGTTLASLERLAVGIDLWALLGKEISIASVEINGLDANVYNTPDSSNIAFIMEAFASDATAPPTDTVATSSAPWQISVNTATLAVSSVDVQYFDPTVGVDLDVQAAQLNATFGDSDVLNGRYFLDALNLADADIRFEQLPTPPDPNPTPLNYAAGIENLRIHNTAVDVKLGEIRAKTAIGALQAEELEARLLPDSIGAKWSALEIRETNIDYNGNEKKAGQNFDPQHLTANGLALKTEAFSYGGLESIQLDLVTLQGILNEKITLKQVTGVLNFNGELLKVQDFAFESEGSKLATSTAQIRHDFLAENQNFDNASGSLQLNRLVVAPRELLYFAPQLAAYISRKDAPFQLSVAASGDLRQMNVEQLNAQGLDAKFFAKGRLTELGTPQEMGLFLPQLTFEATGDRLLQLLPDSLLPADQPLPQSVTLNAALNGRLNDTLNLTTTAEIWTPERDALRLVADGNVTNASTDSLTYNLDIQEFTGNKAALTYYVPNANLPEGYTLPNSVAVTGQVSGTRQSIAPDLTLRAEMDSGIAQLTTSGKVSSFAPLNMELAAKNVRLDAAFITDLLPPQTIPKDLIIPDITSGKFTVSGGTKNLNTSMELDTDIGGISGLFIKQNETYSWGLGTDSLLFLEALKGELYDSLKSINVAAIDLSLSGNGKKLQNWAEASAETTFEISATNSDFRGLSVKAKLKDEHVSGVLDFKESIGELSARFQSNLDDRHEAVARFEGFDLSPIPFVHQPLMLDGKLEGAVRYDSITNADGTFSLDDFKFTHAGEVYPLDTLTAQFDLDPGASDFQIHSPWVDAEAQGAVQLNNIANSVIAILDNYLKNDQVSETATGAFEASIDWKNTDLLTSGLIPGLTVLEPFSINVELDAQQKLISGTLDLPKVNYQQFSIEALKGTIQTEAERISYAFSGTDLNYINDQNKGDLAIRGALKQGVLSTTFSNIDTTESTRFRFTTRLQKTGDQYRLALNENIVFNSEGWQIPANNAVLIGDTTLSVTNWILQNNEQSIQINSVDDQSIELSFKQLNISDLLGIVQLEDRASGQINGTATLYNPLTQLTFTTDLGIDELTLNQEAMGNAQVQISNAENAAEYNVDVALNGAGNQASITGIYAMEDALEPINFDLDIESLKLSPFQPFAAEYLTSLTGNLTTQSSVAGAADGLSVDGFVQFSEAEMTIRELGAQLALGNEKIVLDGNVIRFEDFMLADSSGNKATLNAFILTSNFYEYEFDLEVKANNFLVLNTTAKDNDLYYGRLSADITANITGDLENPIVEVSASPRENSKLTYVLPATNSVVDYGKDVVTFVNANGTRASKIDEPETSPLRMTLLLNLEVNDNLDFTAVIDPIADNQFSGTGEGFLSYAMYPSGEMEMSGTVTLKKGTYDFVYADFVKREFDVVEGSSLTWTGDLLNPQLDVQVQYQVDAPGYPLVANKESLTGSAESALRSNQTFVVELDITGTLEKTEITTDLNYPDTGRNTNNPNIQSAITQLKNNQNRLNEQAFGLILFNSFISEDLVSNAKILNAQEGINEAISEPLNRLANQYIKFVELDFGLESYDAYDASGNTSQQTSVNLTVRKRFFGDRLTISIDGETGSENNAQSSETQVYLDNLTVEYQLTKNGTWLIKAYNERDQEDPLAPDISKTGAALIIRKDFERINLFGKKIK